MFCKCRLKAELQSYFRRLLHVLQVPPEGGTPNLLHRIVATRAKGLTSQQPPNRHAGSLDRAVSLDRFARILGTARRESAGRRQPGRDSSLVKLQQRNQNKAHRSQSLEFRLQAASKYCRLKAELRAALIPPNLLNNPTKLGEAKFFFRVQQRPLRVDYPVVSFS